MRPYQYYSQRCTCSGQQKSAILHRQRNEPNISPLLDCIRFVSTNVSFFTLQNSRLQSKFFPEKFIQNSPYFVRQLMEPAQPPMGVMMRNLLHGNHVPDAGTPMGQQGKDQHEQGENNVAVLRISVHFLQQPGQAQQSYQFEQIQVDF